MVKHYVIATQQPWGRTVFDAVIRAGEGWRLVQSESELRMALLVQPARYVFFVNYSSFVPSDIRALSEPVNFHAFGPGPVWHRGGAPIENLLLRGYTETMIWAHRMTAEVDAGPVYGSRGPVSLGPVRYIVKPDTWFMPGTEARLIDDYRPAMNSGLFEGLRRCEHPDAEARAYGEVSADEEVCGFDEFEIKPSCTKEQILDRFISPCVDLIRWIVETEPEPVPQVGEVVTFSRLPKDAYEKFWRERA